VRFAPLSFAAVLLASVSLTSCAAGSPSASDCAPLLQPGSLTAATRVSSTFGSSPKVKLPSDTEISYSEREVISHTDTNATVAHKGDLVSINFEVLNGTTGEVLDSTPFSAKKASAPVIVSKDFAFAGLYKGLLCASPGDRLLLAIAPQDGLGYAASGEWGLSPDSSLIMVIDVVSVSPPKANGTERQLPNGFPNVVTTGDGQVGVVLPPSTPPTEVRFAERIVGDGAKITAEDVVIGQSLSVDWSTKSVLSSTWQQGSPTSFGTQAQGTEIRTFLTGQTVGSQVVLIAPSATGATVTVVDILGVG
jgi:hypothetical protein